MDTNTIYKALVKTLAEATLNGNEHRAKKAKEVLTEMWLVGNPPLAKGLEIFRTVEKLQPNIASEVEAWQVSDQITKLLDQLNKDEINQAKKKLNSKLGDWFYPSIISEKEKELGTTLEQIIDAKNHYQKMLAKKRLTEWLNAGSAPNKQPEVKYTREMLEAIPVFAKKIENKYSTILEEQKQILAAIVNGNLIKCLSNIKQRFNLLFEQHKKSLDDDAVQIIKQVTEHQHFKTLTDDSALLFMGIADLNRQFELNSGIIKESVGGSEERMITTFLLTESAPFEYDHKSIVEDEAGCLTVSGILQRADKLNQNGRIYPFNILKREIDLYKNLIKRKGSFGELDHRDDITVQMKYVSHMITEIHMNDEGLVTGKVKIFDTDQGKNLKAIIKGGGIPGISSRSAGNYKIVNGAKVIDDSLTLICWDFVHEPSTQGAFMYVSEEKQITVAESVLRNPLKQVYTESFSAQIEKSVNNILYLLKD